WFLRRIDAIHPTRFRTSSATQARPGSRRAGESQCAGFVLGPCPCAAAAVSSSAVCQRKISELPSDRMEHVASVLPSGEKPIGPTPPCVSFECQQVLAAGHIPEPDPAVVTFTGQGPAGWIKSQ